MAAHGAGVASFVYLRRVFERLILARFSDFREEMRWEEVEFKKKSMVDKIDFLKGYLPNFLTENAKIYSILSLGIHELEEEKCLAAFGFLKDSIIFILKDDKAKREEVELRKKLKNEIAAFSHEYTNPVD